MTSPKVVSLSTESDNFETAREIIRSVDATVPKLVGGETVLTAEQVAAEYGTQGHYLGDLDMAELVENEIAEIVKAVQNPDNNRLVNKDEAKAAEKLGAVPRTYTIEEVIAKVEAGEISIKDAKKNITLARLS